MTRLGFTTLLPAEWQSPIITSFVNPSDARFDFSTLYDKLKARRFVIYPGKVSKADCFRVGTIGHVFPANLSLLVKQIEEVLAEIGVRIRD